MILKSPAALLTLGGILLVAVLAVRKVPGSILLGVGAVSAVAWALDLAPLPEQWIAAPHLPRETFLAMDFSRILEGGMLAAVAAFFFVTLLDTAGTLLGVGMLGGFVDKNGDLPRANRAFAADAIVDHGRRLPRHLADDRLHRVGDRHRRGRAHRAHRGDRGRALRRGAGVRADLRRGAGGGDRARRWWWWAR